MKQFILIFLIVFTTQAQQKINLVVNEKFRVVETATDSLISNHNFEREATESLINYFNETGSETGRIFYPSEMRIDFEGSKPIARSEVVLDTFTTIADYILLDFTDSLIQPTSTSKKYALITSIGLAEIEADTIYRFQKYFKLARERGFGYAKYKSISLPFQIRDGYIYNVTNNSAKVHINITKKQKKITGYLDNIQFKEFNPGTSSKINDIDYWFWFNITDLEPNKEYLLRVEVVSEIDEFDFVELIIKTIE